MNFLATLNKYVGNCRFAQIYKRNLLWKTCGNRDKVFQNGPSEICGRQPVFHKFYLIHFRILCPNYYCLYAFTLPGFGLASKHDEYANSTMVSADYNTFP